MDVTHDEYDVEEIVGKCFMEGHPYYLIKWAGYDASESSWEPLDHCVNCLDMIEDYESMRALIDYFDLLD
jgi:poly(3-hydroxyalkanoate) synthetase